MATKSIINEKAKLEQHRKEDKAFFAMMIAFAVTLIIEFALIYLYRKYYAGYNYRPVLRLIQWTFLGITALSGIAFIYCAVTKKSAYLKRLFATGAVLFGCAVIIRLTNTLGIVSLSTSCIVVPVILLLYIIYQIYQVEFFVASLFSALGIFTMWYTAKVFYIRYSMRLYVMWGVLALLIVLAVITFFAMKNSGFIGNGKLRFKLYGPKTSYKSLYLTCGVTAGLFLVYYLFEKVIFQYPLITPYIMAAFAAYAFIAAIYYTIKLM